MKRTPSAKSTTTKKPSAMRPINGVGRPEADQVLGERMLQRLRGGGDMRARKIRRIKAAIKVRSYENALKLAVAVDRLIA